MYTNSNQGGVGRIRVFRQNTLAIATSLTTLAWDATSSLVTANASFSRTGGDIVANEKGLCNLNVNVVVPGALLLASVRLRVQSNGVSVFDNTDTRTVGGQQIIQCNIDFDVLPTHVIRCDCTIGGLASANVGLGDIVTFASAKLFV